MEQALILQPEPTWGPRKFWNMLAANGVSISTVFQVQYAKLMREKLWDKVRRSVLETAANDN